MTLAGAQIGSRLGQQWAAPPWAPLLHLGISKGLSHSWSASAPMGQEVHPASIGLDRTPIDPAAAHRVTVNPFLTDGGDRFTVLTEGTERIGGGGDLDALITYLTANPGITGPIPGAPTPPP